MEALEDKVEAQGRSQEGLTQYVLDLGREATERFQAIDKRLDLFINSVETVDSRIPALSKAVMEFGAQAAQRARDQWEWKDSHTSLVAHVEKIEEAVSKLVKPAA